MTVTPQKKETPTIISRYRMRRQVRWADTDASGMIHIGAFVRLLEETEYGFLRSRGLSVILTDGKGLLGFPRLSANVTMTQPLFFDDEIDVEIRLVKIDGKMIEYDFEVTEASDAANADANTDADADADADADGDGDGETGELIGSGRFKVAVCRFPANALPYAVLTPEYVIEALTSPVN